MFQVDPQTRSILWGVVVIVLGVGWTAFGLLGNRNTVFLATMLILTIVLGASVAFFVRNRSAN
jgi:hypothetical protein